MHADLWGPQNRAVAFVRNRSSQSGGIFAEVGGGKTRMALTLADPYERSLALTPVSSLYVWEDEAKLIGADCDVITLGSGTSEQKAALVLRLGSGQSLIVSNYETYWRPKLFKAIEKYRPQFLISDECQRLRYHTAKQSREAAKMRRWQSVKAAVGLSGTPATSQPREGMFGIFRFIDPTVFGDKWGIFANRYLRMVNMGSYNKVVGYQNEDEFDRKIAEASIQIAKSEILPWLPPARDQFVHFDLDTDSMRRYKQFAKDAVAEITGEQHVVDSVGELAEILYGVQGTSIARIALVTLLRLQQLTGGFITTDAGEIVVSKEKVDVCVDLVEKIRSANKSVVIFYRFNQDRRSLKVAIEQQLQEPVAILAGGMTPDAQRAALNAFKEKKRTILLCQIHKAIGVNQMVAASDAIYFSTGFSLEDMIQSKGRLDRPGQTEPVVYYHLLANKTVDLKVYKALTTNMNIAREFISLDYVKGFLTSA